MTDDQNPFAAPTVDGPMLAAPANILAPDHGPIGRQLAALDRFIASEDGARERAAAAAILRGWPLPMALAGIALLTVAALWPGESWEHQAIHILISVVGLLSLCIGAPVAFRWRMLGWRPQGESLDQAQATLRWWAQKSFWRRHQATQSVLAPTARRIAPRLIDLRPLVVAAPGTQAVLVDHRTTERWLSVWLLAFTGGGAARYTDVGPAVAHGPRWCRLPLTIDLHGTIRKHRVTVEKILLLGSDGHWYLADASCADDPPVRDGGPPADPAEVTPDPLVTAG